VKDLSFCPQCGASVDEEDKFCRNCSEPLQPESKPKTASATELAKIAGIQERIKEYGSASNWTLVGGAGIGAVVMMYLIISQEVAFSYAVLVFLLIYIPFGVLSGIINYYNYKLQRKLEKGELN